MDIPLRHDGRFVPEQLLYLVKIDPALYEGRRKGMTQIVEVKILDRCLAQRKSKRSRR